MNLSKVLFWDTDYNSIDWDKMARYVIERVIMYGNTDDWRAIQKRYGNELILSEMLKSRNLDARSLSFLSTLFEISETQFKCYTQIQSSQGHWTY